MRTPSWKERSHYYKQWLYQYLVRIVFLFFDRKSVMLFSPYEDISDDCYQKGDEDNVFIIIKKTNRHIKRKWKSSFFDSNKSKRKLSFKKA